MKRENVLIIFAKAPRLGSVKTRLQPELTLEQSLLLYKAMGEDLVSHFCDSSDFDLQIHFWPPDAEEELQQWLGGDLTYITQNEGDLGVKMHLAFSHAFCQDYHRAVIIGSDLPMLTDGHIRNAFQQLETHDIVLGPTDDGGYYLIGVKAPHPELFENVVWSTSRVWSQTLKNIRRAGLRSTRLSQKTDLDTYLEVLDLWERLNQPESGNNEKIIPRTMAVLTDLFR